jgi:hypothetical protein
MLMIFWIITPLQSAIFTTGTVTRSIDTIMGTVSALIPLSEQTTALTTNFIDTAYGVTWLNQKLPPFTTHDLAFLPFQPSQDLSEATATETWTTTTNAYYTNLSCTPALVERKSAGYTFNNGRGCIVPDVTLLPIDNSTQYMITYIGYYDDTLLDWSLKNPNCSDEFSNNFLALFAPYTSETSAGVYSNLTALFCEPIYVSEELLVTVNASTYEIEHFQSINKTSSTTELGDIFNVSNFEYLIANGVPFTNNPSSSQYFNFSVTGVLAGNSHIQDFGVTWPNAIMVGYAVALTDSPVAEWSQQETLRRTFEKVHQLMFVSAFNILSMPAEGFLDPKAGTRQDTPGAVIFVRTISIVVEVIFGIITVFTICFWYYYRSRCSNMQSDPASIADIMSMVSPDGAMSADMHDNGRLTADLLERSISQNIYWLESNEKNGPVIRPISSSQPRNIRFSPSPRSSILSTEQSTTFSAVRPLELQFAFGSAFIGLLLVALVTIFVLYYWSLKHNGRCQNQVDFTKLQLMK